MNTLKPTLLIDLLLLEISLAGCLPRRMLELWEAMDLSNAHPGS